MRPDKDLWYDWADFSDFRPVRVYMPAADTRFSPLHTWVRKEGELYIVGISQFAQNALGDLVYVELPPIGQPLKAGEVAGVAESVKTASDILAPVDGTVVEVNEKLQDDPETINEDPYHTGWIFKLTPADPAQYDNLLNEEQYLDQVQ